MLASSSARAKKPVPAPRPSIVSSPPPLRARITRFSPSQTLVQYTLSAWRAMRIGLQSWSSPRGQEETVVPLPPATADPSVGLPWAPGSLDVESLDVEACRESCYRGFRHSSVHILLRRSVVDVRRGKLQCNWSEGRHVSRMEASHT